MKLNELIAYNFLMISLYIDADSLPKTHREIVIRRILKDKLPAFFVADRPLPDVLEAIALDTKNRRDPYRSTLEADELKKIKSEIKMIVVDSGTNAADDKLVELATPSALAITHDIPLASRLLEKGLYVIDDRGREFTLNNIKELLSIRGIMGEFREMGIFSDKSVRFNQKIINDFSNCFDSVLQRLSRQK